MTRPLQLDGFCFESLLLGRSSLSQMLEDRRLMGPDASSRHTHTFRRRGEGPGLVVVYLYWRRVH